MSQRTTFPEHWSWPFSASGADEPNSYLFWNKLRLADIDEGCDEWKVVENRLHDGPPQNQTDGGDLPRARLVKLQRIQRRFLWDRYHNGRELVKSTNGGESNEMLLWHGTGVTPPVDVLRAQHGLDMRFGGESFYGRGLYLSELARYQTGGRYVR